MEKGAITNEHKEINKYKTVCTTITGTEHLYQYVHQNPSIELNFNKFLERISLYKY